MLYFDRRNDEFRIKRNCTLHTFEKNYIDVMHNHDDKHPAWSEAEISRPYFNFDPQPNVCPEEKWCLNVDVMNNHIQLDNHIR